MKTFPLFIVIILFTACGSIKPAAPNLPLSQLSTTPLPDSKIDLPISIDLTQVFNDFTGQIPAQLSGQGTAGPAQYRWQIQRDPFNLALNGNALDIIDAAHFNGGGYLKNPLNGKWISVCSCNADATIGIHTSFSLTKNYSLAGNAALTRFDLSTCNLNVLNFDVSAIIKTKAQDAINTQLILLNQRLNQYNFKPMLQPAWAALYQPVKIADLGDIVINPSAVRVSQPSGSGNSLKFIAGITARPVFYFSNPGKAQATGLPDISSGGNGNGFNLTMDLHLDYQPLNNLLTGAIQNQKIDAGTNTYIIIQDAQIYGSGNNHLLIKVKFTGKKGAIPYHGLLYFTCIPQYEASTGTLYVNDIDFDVNTIAKLKEGPAVWILGSAIKKYIGSQVHFNIAAQINGLKDKLNTAINQPISGHLTLSGNVNQLNLQDILPDKGFILVRVNTAGNLAVRVN